MGLLRYFKRKKEEKEYLHHLYEKAGVTPSSSNAKSTGKYPSKPIYREVLLKPNAKMNCPECGSRFIRPAGYGDRLECQDCGKVFSR